MNAKKAKAIRKETSRRFAHLSPEERRNVERQVRERYNLLPRNQRAAVVEGLR